MGWKWWDTLLTVSTGGYWLIYKLGKNAYDTNKELKKIQKSLNSSSASVKDDVENLPYLKGASNSLSTGKTQPYVIGTHLFTPYILNGNGGNSKGFSEFSGNLGEKQFYNLVLEGGFCNQSLQSIFCDDLKLRDFDGQTVQKGRYYFDTASPFASADSFIEISQGGDGITYDGFKYKTVEQTPSTQLNKKPASSSDDGGDNDKYEDLYFTLEENTMSVDFTIMFDGLLHYDSEGKKQNKTRNIVPYYSLDYAKIIAEGGDVSSATWSQFGFDKVVHHEAVTTTQKANFGFTTTGVFLPGIYYTDSEAKNIIIKNKNKWVYKSGTESIKNDYDSIDITVNRKKSGQLYTYNPTIKVSKSTTTPAYDETTHNNTSFTGKYSKQIRFTAHKDFTYSDVKNLDYPITIKVTSPDRETTSGSDVDTCYIQSIRSNIYNKRESENSNAFVKEKNIADRENALSTVIGLHIESTQANEEKLSSIQIITSGIARTFESNAWSTSKKVTSNPASWWLEVATSDMHPASKIADSEIDLESFGAWYDFCESNNFTVNYVVSNGMTKSAILDLIANCGRAYIYRDLQSNKFAVAIDKIDESTDCPLLNEQNLISFNYSKDGGRQPDGVKVSFINSEENYQKDSFILTYERYKNGVDLWTYPEQRSTDCVLTEISADGITNYKEAFRYALFTMKCANLRLKTATAKVSVEAATWKALQKVYLQHPTLKIGLGSAEIKSVITNADNKAIGFKLYNPIDLTGRETHHAIVNSIQNDSIKTSTLTLNNETSITDEISFSPVSNVFASGDILSYGYGVNTITSPFVVIGMSPSEDGFDIKLAEYDERIFSETTDIPEYKPNLTQPKKAGLSVPSTLPSPTIAEVNETIRNAVDTIDMSIVESPNIYSDLMSFSFSVDDNSTTPISQQIKTQVHVIQESKEIEFAFGEIELPTGFSVNVDYHSLVFSVEKDLRISTGYITIPVIFRKLIHNNFYADETEALYEDESGEVYGEITFDTKETVYNLVLNFNGVKGGKYLGKIDNVSNIPSTLVIGDYFVWSGASGDFYKTTAVYYWTGLNWKKDENENHNATTLKDVLGIANDDLQQNNSKAWEYLDHLTANSIFVDKLVANDAFINKLVANEAFIDKLFATNLILKNDGFLQSENYSYKKEGFKIFANGIAEFNKGFFNGGLGEFIESINEITLKPNTTGKYITTYGNSYKDTEGITHKIVNFYTIDYTTSDIFYNGNVSSYAVCYKSSLNDVYVNTEWALFDENYYKIILERTSNLYHIKYAN